MIRIVYIGCKTAMNDVGSLGISHLCFIVRLHFVRENCRKNFELSYLALNTMHIQIICAVRSETFPEQTYFAYLLQLF